MGEAHRWEPPKEQDIPKEEEDSSPGIDEFIFIFFWAIIVFCLCYAGCADSKREQESNNINNTASNHVDLEEFRRQSRPRDPLPVELRRSQPEDVRKAHVQRFFYSRTLEPDESVRNLSDILASTNTDDDESLSQREQSSVSTRMWRGMKDSIRSMIVGGKKAECSICLSHYEAGDTVYWAKNEACNHIYHQECVLQWLECHDDCPLCRTNLLQGDAPED
jgi:hypothetical protein